MSWVGFVAGAWIGASLALVSWIVLRHLFGVRWAIFVMVLLILMLSLEVGG